MNIKNGNRPVTDNILSIINQKGIKQKYVSQLMNCNEADFSNMLNGRKVIRATDIVNICKALDVTPNDLFSTSSNAS